LLDIGAFTWRTLWNAAISLVRKSSHEKAVAQPELLHLTGFSREASPEGILAGIAAKEILDEMSDRDRLICYLDHQGFGVSEIAAHLNITPSAVSKAQSRRLARLTAKMASK
jgi:DNA-directed RNA polymerase specialized sigma24 family protein